MEEKFKEWFERHDVVMDDHDALIDELKLMLEGEPPPPPPPPGRVDEPWWPSRNKTAGVTAFPLAMRNREYIREVVEYLKANGYNCVSVGAQTDGWIDNNNPILPVGPTFGSAQWAEDLDELLDETARHKDFWVQLIPTFTHKGRGGFDYQKNLCKKVCDVVLAGDYKHVFWSVMNEFKHPITHDDLGDTDIKNLGSYLKNRTGFPVSTDHGGREKDTQTGERVWKAYYPEAWQGFDYYCWHPTRNPEPTANQFKKAHARWPEKTLLYNETVCYGSVEDTRRWPQLVGKGTMANKGRGSEEDRRWKVRDIKNNIKLAGQRSQFFFHSIWLGIRSEGIGWIPKY